MVDIQSDLITTAELGKKLRVSREAIRLWVIEGCPVAVEKRPRLFIFSDVVKWLNEDRQLDRNKRG